MESDNKLSNMGWPVLTYHLVDPNVNDRNSTSPQKFEETICQLLANGFSFYSLDQIYESLILRDPKRNGLILAFDDAYSSILDYAFPILEKYDVPFALFVSVDYVGLNNLWNTKARYICKHLTWEDLSFLHNNLATIGSHCCSHHSLIKFSSGKIEEELSKSKVVLEEKLNNSINFVAYPYGDVTDLVETIACRYYTLGFSASQGSWGWIKHPWAINRILVNSSDSCKSIIDTIQSIYLNGCYDKER